MGSRRIYLRLSVLSAFVVVLSSIGFAQGWRIDSAEYGGAAPRRVDVTGQLINLVRGGASIQINNETMGVDPAPGEVKYLHIRASRPDGRVQDFQFREHEYLDPRMFMAEDRDRREEHHDHDRDRGPEQGEGHRDRDHDRGPVWGRGARPDRGACFYKDFNFSGDYFCMAAGQSYGYLRPGFNDQITSIRVFHAEVIIFNDRDFRGVSGETHRSIGDLRNWRLPTDPRRSWNDKVSSVQVN